MNSLIAYSYARREFSDARLFSTADFDGSRAGSLTNFEARVRGFLGIGRGLHRRIDHAAPANSTLAAADQIDGLVLLMKSILSGVLMCENLSVLEISRREHFR